MRRNTRNQARATRSPRRALSLLSTIGVLLAIPSVAAATVVFDGTNPTSPASPANETNPLVKGTSDGPVTLYKDVNCTNAIGSGTEAEFESTGIAVTVAANKSTDIYADDGDGCTTTPVTYVEDSTAPAAPTVDSTDPASPANENDPKVKGSAETDSTVKLYTTDDCTGTVAASGPESDFSSTGIAAHVADDTTTTFYATATDAAGNVSPCSSTSAEYVEDSKADPPTFTAVSPASPANDNDPKVIGTAETDSTVNLFTTDDCTGTVAASGPESAFGADGIAVHVEDDSTTTFHGTVTDEAGNVSACSTESITYVEDSTAPEAPNLAATNPIGPANDNQPELVGSAEVGSTVTVFLTPDCSGTPLASGTESDFALSGLTVPVADDSVTVFYATATDAAGNQSGCTVDPVTYFEDSTAPDTRVTFAPAGKTRDRTPTFLFTVLGHEADVSFVCQIDEAPFKPCKSPKTYGKLSLRHHEFRVRAVDEAGNADRSAASRGFRLVRRPRH
jgi:hypothetical protein